VEKIRYLCNDDTYFMKAREERDRKNIEKVSKLNCNILFKLAKRSKKKKFYTFYILKDSYIFFKFFIYFLRLCKMFMLSITIFNRFLIMANILLEH